MAHLNAEIGLMLGGQPDGKQQVPRVTGGQLTIINPALQNLGLFIDKLFQKIAEGKLFYGISYRKSFGGETSH